MDIAPSSDAGCTTWRGGKYDILASETRNEASADDFPADGPGYPESRAYTDVFTINENATLNDFPLEVPIADWAQQGYHPMMAIGLGSNSTILHALKAGRQIASRTWSMFYGWTGDDETSQLDGTLVFGGYDRAKVSTPGYTQNLRQNERCGTQMLVTIDDILLHFPNGTDVSIVADTSEGSFDACIVPDFPVLMTIANDPYMEAFRDFTNNTINQRSLGLAYYTLLYDDEEEPYRGDMIINIRDGPSVFVPNKQLVLPERTIQEEDGQIVANYSRSNLVINPLQDINMNDLSILGRHFLSSAYVMVNQDMDTFTLWSTDPTHNEDLVGIDEEGKEVSEWCHTGASQEPTPSDQTDPPPDYDGNGLSSGPIAGIVVGGVAFAAIVIGVIFWRRRRGKVNAAANLESDSSPPAHQAMVDHRLQYYPAEMGTDSEAYKSEPSYAEMDTQGQVGGLGPREPLAQNRERYELTG